MALITSGCLPFRPRPYDLQAVAGRDGQGRREAERHRPVLHDLRPDGPAAGAHHTPRLLTSSLSPPVLRQINTPAKVSVTHNIAMACNPPDLIVGSTFLRNRGTATEAAAAKDDVSHHWHHHAMVIVALPPPGNSPLRLHGDAAVPNRRPPH